MILIRPTLLQSKRIFLSPAANQERGITDARTKAMQLIACIHKSLQEYIPGQIGRYNDTFNPNCVGDRFTSLGVPTVLYESGHHGLDYDRNFTKEVTVKALISGLQSIASRDYLKQSIDNYNLIPQNMTSQDVNNTRSGTTFTSMFSN